LKKSDLRDDSFHLEVPLGMPPNSIIAPPSSIKGGIFFKEIRLKRISSKISKSAKKGCS